MQLYKRPSIVSITSSGASALPSTPSSASSSLVQPSPLAATLARPNIMEDADEDKDEERPPSIEVGDELVDDAPFDPSIPDEIYWQMRQQALSLATSSSTTSRSLQEYFSRLLNSQKSGRYHIPPSTAISPSPPSVVSWKSVFRSRRENASQEGREDGLLSQDRRVRVQEPAEIISCTGRPPAVLIPLDQAQGREDIVHRMEGFEMAERRRCCGP
jgi:hypothetical protein